MKSIKKIISIALVFIIVFSSSGLNEGFKLFAAPSEDKEMIIKEIKFVKKHTGFNTSGGTINILGEHLDIDKIMFGIEDGFVSDFGTVAESTESYIKVVMTAEEASNYNGEILVGSEVIDLRTANEPNITGPSTQNYIEGVSEDVVLRGVHLDKIDTSSPSEGTYEAVYGQNVLKTPINHDNATIEEKSITFAPTTAGKYGFQNILLSHKFDIGDIKVSTGFRYNNALRILENLDLSDISVYPDVAGKGDYIILESSKFNNLNNYRVYFLSLSDGDYDLDDYKKSPNIKLSTDESKLSVQIPTDVKFKTGDKRIVITKIQNGEIVGRQDVEDTVKIVDATFLPIITRINPAFGPEEGSKVQVIGRNLLIPAIPSLDGNITLKQDVVSYDDKPLEVDIDYNVDGVTFSGKPVSSLTRKIKVTIGKQAGFFEIKREGLTDFLTVITKPIDNIEDDPEKDVLVETTTTVTSSDGKTYTFSQSVVEPDGYKFINSSVQPEIESVVPHKVHLVDSGMNKFKVKKKILLTITGKNFFVNKYIKESSGTVGELKTNYPIVYIQKSSEYGDENFTIKFDKNDANASAYGAIYVENSNEPLKKNGEVVPVELKVYNDDGKLVDGSVGNELGTKMMLYLPEEVNISDLGSRYIQVVNPKRNSDGYGGFGVSLRELLEFVVPSDDPVISTVVPNVVTTEGGEPVTITGSNFKEGVKVYIDGVDVGAVKRSISEQGDKAALEFKAPRGRRAITMITVANPDGGMRTKKFIYIDSNNQDPKIDSIVPNKGTTDTMVLIKGNNFLRPDAGAEDVSDLGAFRLIGSRVLVDGKDVNTYNVDVDGHYQFIPYTVPASNQNLFTLFNNKLKVTSFIDNTTITSSNGKDVYKIAYDAAGNPQFFDGTSIIYTFKYENGKYMAYKADNTPAGEFTQSAGKLSITGGESFNIYMDNHILRGSYNINRELEAELADYHHSVVLVDESVMPKNYYTLQKLVDGTIKLTDGQNAYNIVADGSDITVPKLMAYDKQSKAYEITQTETGMTLTGDKTIELKFLTPYKFDSDTKEIIGNRIKVAAKGKIYLKFPGLDTGTGFKDITVVNPDTRKSTVKDGFYYYELPSTHPIISYVKPNFGSTAGGYRITIHGKEFSDDTVVFFDGEMVPENDTNVSLDGKSIEVKVPKYPVDISEVYGVGRINVPITVVNNDGGSYTLGSGFTYIKPTSAPKITDIVLPSGSTNGGEIVDIKGTDFRFFEPYKNLGGGVEYEKGIDKFTNLNGHLDVTKAWDDLLKVRHVDNVDLWEKKPMPDGKEYFGYDYYYDSPILPKVFFGEERAKIVEFDNGYLRVVTPPHKAERVSVILINNDAGTSNSIDYEYKASSPKIDKLSPNKGARFGGEQVEVTGEGFMTGVYKAYQNDDDTKIVSLEKRMQALLKFGDISNVNIAIGQDNDGRINANRSTVKLDGGLTVSFNGKEKTLKMELVEGGALYSRIFQNYEGDKVYFPAGMLKDGANYYQPTGYGYETPTVYNANNDYELIEIYVDKEQHKLNVTRGFAPTVLLDSDEKLIVRTPSYFTTGQVKVTLINSDDGEATGNYEYTNPSSKPIIYDVNPHDVIAAESLENKTKEEQKFVQASMQGGLVFAITGRDFREGAVVRIGDVEAEIIEMQKGEGENEQIITARAPEADESLVNQKLQIIVENPDTGTANSTSKDKLGKDKRLIYFVYRKPMSFPEIEMLIPDKISEAGDIIVRVVGKDFREGAIVNIGEVDKMTIKPSEVDELGRYIKIYIPSNVKSGIKSVQVINKDFGTVTKDEALNIISAPELSKRIYQENGDPIHTIYTEGGQKIILKGNKFADGAKVYFGGERHKVPQTDVKPTLPEGVPGFYRDHHEYILSGAIEAPEVVFIDEHTLKVTTPEILEEKDFTLTVINPDTGITSGLTEINYGVPIPNRPYNLKVTTVDGKYIKLYDYNVPRVKYYEIFVYIGSKAMSQLRVNQYKDFTSLGTTIYEPYKITHLEGIEDMKKDDRIYFVVKAVNEYGSSRYSNMVYLDKKALRKLNKINQDTDGSIDDMGTKPYITKQNGNKMNINFTRDRYLKGALLNFKAQNYLGMNEIEMTLPDNFVLQNSAETRILSDMVDVYFRPRVFAVPEFNNHNTANMEYVKCHASWKQDASGASALSSLPRRVRAISPTVKFAYQVQTKHSNYDFDKLVTPMAATFNLNSKRIKAKGSNYQVYYYDNRLRTWSKVYTLYEPSANKVSYSVAGSGYYVLTIGY